MPPAPYIRQFWTRLHRDQRGAVSLETILLIGAIALPILIFVIKFGWPQIRNLFSKEMGHLDHEVENVKSGTGN